MNALDRALIPVVARVLIRLTEERLAAERAAREAMQEAA